MKKLFLILSIVTLMSSCFDNGPLKTYRVAITDINSKCDTINYYLHDENYDLSGGFGCMLSLRNGCLCLMKSATGQHQIICGIKSYTLISINETPKSIEVLVTKENKSLNAK